MHPPQCWRGLQDEMAAAWGVVLLVAVVVQWVMMALLAMVMIQVAVPCPLYMKQRSTSN